MLFSRKAELETYKKQQADLIREENRVLKALQDQEVRSKQQSRHDQMKRIKELEDRLFDELEAKAHKSPNSSLDHQYSVNSSDRSLSTSRNDHLLRMREIQDRAKNIINGQSYLKEIPEKAPQHPPKAPDPISSPVKIPVYIPQSMMRKAQNYPPPTVQRVLKNGEVISVHLLSDHSRVNDPLVRAEAQLDQRELAAMSKQMKGKPIKDVISEIQNQFLNAHSSGNTTDNSRSQSLSPHKRHKQAYPKLPEAEVPKERECTTPQGRAEYYMFRDLAIENAPLGTARTWVSQRMKQYSDKVKNSCAPRLSEKKELEMRLLKEKLIRKHPVHSDRVKFLE